MSLKTPEFEIVPVYFGIDAATNPGSKGTCPDCEYSIITTCGTEGNLQKELEEHWFWHHGIMDDEADVLIDLNGHVMGDDHRGRQNTS